MHCKTSIDFGYSALPGEWKIKLINLTCYFVLFRFRSFIQNPTNVKNTKKKLWTRYLIFYDLQYVWDLNYDFKTENQLDFLLNLTDMKIKPQFVEIIYIFEVTGTPDIHPANTTTFVVRKTCCVTNFVRHALLLPEHAWWWLIQAVS